MEPNAPTARPRLRRRLDLPLLAVLLVAALFVWNGTSSAWRTPEHGELRPPLEPAPAELRVLAFNVAKAFFHRGGLRFAPAAEVEARLDDIAELIRTADAHVVFLSEIVWEGGPCRVNQVLHLARRAGMHAYAYGDNYRFGLPFFRVRSGNAILSRLPLRPREVVQLAGGTPFYQPTGNRRILWAELELGGETLRIASVRNDSFDLENNARQAEQILASLGEAPVLLAGDFNAEPGDPAMLAFRRSGRFLRLGSAGPTYPAAAPTRRIDHVLAPVRWIELEYRTFESALSDHRPVLAVYRPDPATGGAPAGR